MAGRTELEVHCDAASLLWQLLTSGMPDDTARWILDLRFPEDWEREAQAFREKNSAGSISDAEMKRLDAYVRVGDLLEFLQSEARLRLAERSNPSL